MTISAPYSRTSSAVIRVLGMNWTLSSLEICRSRYSATRRHARSPGMVVIQLRWPPISAPASTRWTASKPRLPRTTAASIPAGPAPTISTGLSALRRCRELLRVPTAAVLLAAGRVLGAPDRRAALLPAGDADVAADALADVLEAALLDLLRQERIGDRRAGGADDVGLPGVDDADHDVRVGEPARR